FAREQFLGRRRRRVRVFQRRQGLGIERAGKHRVNQVLFLREGRTRGGEGKDSEQASGSAHQQLYFLRVCRKLKSSCNHAQDSELEEPESDAYRCETTI